MARNAHPPLPPPDAAAIGTVKLAIPGAAGYATVTASQVDTGPITESSGYTAFADVTALVNAAGAGNYTVANIQTGTGGNSIGGWSLVVAYSDPTESLRNLTVFDGLTVTLEADYHEGTWRDRSLQEGGLHAPIKR